MKQRVQEFLSDAGWTMAMGLGLYSLAQLAIDLWHRRRVTVELDAPWPFVADFLQLAAIGSVAMLWVRHEASPWAWLAAAALATRFAWEWRWGFACWPRRTRFGQWLDRRLAALDHRIYNWGKR